MSELLHGRWQETKEALLEGLQGTKRSVMSTTLENTRSICQNLLQLVLLLPATSQH